MLEIKRTNSDHPDFRKLVAELDLDLAIKNGDMNDFFVPFNRIDLIQFVLLAYLDEKPVACGAIKEFEDGVMEIKRMFVLPVHRKKGIASAVLIELQQWSKELGSNSCLLETGGHMKDAIALYEKNGFVKIPNYGQYASIESSVCFKKVLV